MNVEFDTPVRHDHDYIIQLGILSLGFVFGRNGTLTVLHERRGFPVVVPASVLVPHIGIVRLGVLVLDPSRGGGDGDYVKNNGEEQEQGQDKPAAIVRDPTAKHD